MSIKLLHFADLHLGVENYGRINPSTGLSTRFEDFARTLDRVVTDAVELPVDLVIFAGDAYKNRDPSPTHQKTFAQAMHRLSRANIPTIVLLGNHDLPNTRGRAHSVEVFRVLDVPNITIADYPTVLKIATRNGPVQVMTLPYRRLSIQAQDPALRGKDHADVTDAVEANYSYLMDQLGSQLDPTIPTVLTGHLAVGGAQTGSERSMMLSDEPLVPLSCLSRPDLPIDYIALGHMHRRQDLNRGSYPAVVYSGSLERVDFGEETDTKGYALVDLVRGETTYHFVDLLVRRFVSIECDLISENPVQELQAAVDRASIKDSVVRLRYSIPEDKKMLLSGADIHRTLSGAFAIGRVERDLKTAELRQRDPHLTDSLDPWGALNRYVSIKPPRSPVNDVLEYGKALIQDMQRQEEAL